MSDDKYDSLKDFAEDRPRDEHGHFIPLDQSEHLESHGRRPAEGPTHINPISQFLHDETAIHKSNDDELVDIHVGNPLHKIVQLLSDIKKQKAFSFTMKGSLGIAGVALALGVFGVFGGGKILCDKGVQSQIGTIHTLLATDEEPSTLPFIGNLINYFVPPPKHNRIVLVDYTNNAIRLEYSRTISFVSYGNYPVIATGNLDSCARTLTVNDPSHIEIYR